MYRDHFYRGGAALMGAIAGIDQSLWDIKGEALGVPIEHLVNAEAGTLRKQSKHA